MSMWDSIIHHPDIFMWAFSIGVLFCLSSLLLLYRKIAVLLKSEKAKGKVIGMTEQKDLIEPSTFSPVVEFLDVNMSRVEFHSRVTRRPQPYKIGDNVIVRYNPKSPENAYIVSITEVFFLELGLLIFGLGTMFLTFSHI